MKIVYNQSKDKAKELALGAFNKMEDALKVEVTNLMGKYKDLRHSVKGII